MNSLSWLIYLGQFFDRFPPFVFVFIILPTLILIVFRIVRWLNSADSDKYSWGNKEKTKQYKNIASQKLPFIIIFFAAISLLLVPSSRTFYMIAASEVGEEIIKNPEVSEMMHDVKTILKNKIKENLAE